MVDAAAEPAVEVIGLRKHYRGKGANGQLAEVKAVDGVSLSVRPGELVVLLGPSGCGKTTLLRSVAGLDKPDAGEIRIAGRCVFSADKRVFVPPEDRHIAMMFQSYALWPHMTVARNVAYPLPPAAGADEVQSRVASMLERLGIAGLGHRYPGELSGGQQQRVALARALVASPSLVLFDEPLSNVDARVRRRLRAELRELKAATHFAGIYVTHDQEEAMELADVLVVMDSGAISQMATPRQVYTHPASMYVAQFVGDINRWEARVEAVSPAALRVSCALGSFDVARHAKEAAVGDTGWLAIRPEHVALASLQQDSAAAPAAFRGVVREAVYLGARVECRIDLQGAELLAWVPDSAAAAMGLAPGVAVGVTLDHASMRWLPR